MANSTLPAGLAPAYTNADWCLSVGSSVEETLLPVSLFRRPKHSPPAFDVVGGAAVPPGNCGGTVAACTAPEFPIGPAAAAASLTLSTRTEAGSCARLSSTK